MTLRARSCLRTVGRTRAKRYRWKSGKFATLVLEGPYEVWSLCRNVQKFRSACSTVNETEICWRLRVPQTLAMSYVTRSTSYFLPIHSPLSIPVSARTDAQTITLNRVDRAGQKVGAPMIRSLYELPGLGSTAVRRSEVTLARRDYVACPDLWCLCGTAVHLDSNPEASLTRF